MGKYGGKKWGREKGKKETERGREWRKERVLTTKFIIKPSLIYDSFKNHGKNLLNRQNTCKPNVKLKNIKNSNLSFILSDKKQWWFFFIFIISRTRIHGSLEDWAIAHSEIKKATTVLAFDHLGVAKVCLERSLRSQLPPRFLRSTWVFNSNVRMLG